MRNERLIKNKVVYNKFFLENLLVALLISFSSLVIYIIDISLEKKLFLFAWTGNLILAWGIIVFKKIKKQNINPYTIFFLSYFFFSYGQIFLYSLGLEYSKFNLIQLFPNEQIIAYCLYFSIGTCFLLLGALTAIKKDLTMEKEIEFYKKHDNLKLDKSVKNVGWIMFVFSAPIYIQNLLTNLINSINYGYKSIYETSETSALSNIIGSLSSWFVPSLFILLVVYKKTRYFKFIILSMLLLISVATFSIGTRSGAMAIIVSLLYLWNSEIRKFKRVDKIILGAVLLIIFSILPIIQTFRGLNDKSLMGFINLSQNMQDESNLFVEIIGELGGSMQPWLLVNQLIPEAYNFKLGQSYIASFLALIPSILLGGHSATEYAHLSGWLQEAANMSYGPGFSILAEAYYNYGWFGVPVLFLIGWLYFKFLSNNMLDGNIIKFKNLFSTIALFSFVTSARSSLYLTIRTEFYAIFIPITLIILIYREKRKTN